MRKRVISLAVLTIAFGLLVYTSEQNAAAYARREAGTAAQETGERPKPEGDAAGTGGETAGGKSGDAQEKTGASYTSAEAGTEDALGRKTVFYCQKSEEWAKEKLGSSFYTMKRAGCVVCSLSASLAMQSEDASLTPHVLNELLETCGVYDGEGNVQWYELEKLQLPAGGRIRVEVLQEETDEALAAALQEGRLPIVKVRVGGDGSFHFVLLVREEDGVFYCMDPLQPEKKLTPLSAFGNKRYGVRYVDWEET